jgi:IS30 family transposase
VTYDQGREMAQCGRLSEITGVAVCFADQHIPWQRQPKAVADSPAKVIVIA